MKQILLVGFLWVALAVSAQADPVAWADRCFEEATVQKADVSKSSRIDAGHCSRTILNFCTYDIRSDDCFGALQIEYDASSEKILSIMPASIDANDVLQSLYLKRLSTVQNFSQLLKCSDNKSLQICGAEQALQRHQLAQKLPNLLAVMEEKK